ncbi:hypothetical protein QVD17_07839 [Tagetes erecta]|uniref:Harbinger transposase-derived protein n=1 Tax=Tagetes erecta TaxID=13708 RepID=A0AAD8L3P7_TARER|nr:hypothetical protein QVD17_07839 [Tagetes erecta]
MSSSSSQLYNHLLNDDDDTSSDEYEEEMAVTSAMSFVVRGLFEETENTTNPIRKRVSLERDRAKANENLMKDYFVESPTYPDPNTFRRRFRMSKRLFLRIVNDLESDDSYFKQKRDARGLLGFTGIQKCTSALRVLAYGNTTDINDEYLKMSEKTTRDTLEHFTKGIIKIYGQRYLRKPTWNDLQRIYEVHQEVQGLPGMIGSIDCMHWEWFNCPTAWRGQHTRGDQGVPTLMLQAVASYDLWIWHAHFGTAGSNNDLNVLEESSIIEDVVSGGAPIACFYANGNYHPHGYYLGDGIYPEYPIFAVTYRDPIDEKRAYFKKVQESSRKDIERCFGVLQQRWHIIQHPCRLWTKDKIRDVMYACIILHNMILEDDGNAICQNYIPDQVEEEITQATFEERVANDAYLRNKHEHYALMADLIEHAWSVRTIPDNDDDAS